MRGNGEGTSDQRPSGPNRLTSLTRRVGCLSVSHGLVLTSLTRQVGRHMSTPVLFENKSSSSSIAPSLPLKGRRSFRSFNPERPSKRVRRCPSRSPRVTPDPSITSPLDSRNIFVLGARMGEDPHSTLEVQRLFLAPPKSREFLFEPPKKTATGLVTPLPGSFGRWWRLRTCRSRQAQRVARRGRSSRALSCPAGARAPLRVQ